MRRSKFLRRAKMAAITVALGSTWDVARAATVPDRQIFLDEFLPNLELANHVRWDQWRRQFPDESTAWLDYVNELRAGDNTPPPTFQSRFGRALAGAARMALDETSLPPLPSVIYPSPTIYPSEVL